jgi:DNA modification methylase
MRHKRHGSSKATISIPQQIKYLAIDSISSNPRNARTHSVKQINQIAASMREFGFVGAIIVNPDGMILAGHARYEAAKLLRLKTVPTIALGHLSEERLRAYVIADNRLAEKAGWDKELLSIELQELRDLEFDFDSIGFDGPEIEVILDAAEPSSTTSIEDNLPDLEPERLVTRQGDLWTLGEHRLLCGDARRRDALATLMPGELAQLVFVDPPYNVKIHGHATGNGRVRHREFAQASGEKTAAQFTKFLEESLGLLAEYSVDGSIHFVCMDWRHLDETLLAGRRTYRELKNVVVWNKTNAGMGSFYRSQHELIFVWKHGRGKHINNIELGRHGRNRSNVWTYAGCNAFGADRDEQLGHHPTAKPTGLVADAIRDCSRHGDIVLDSFGGAGTTLIACEQTHRRARLIEIDPTFCDLTVRRWQNLTGQLAYHAITGEPFDYPEPLKRGRRK